MSAPCGSKSSPRGCITAQILGGMSLPSPLASTIERRRTTTPMHSVRARLLRSRGTIPALRTRPSTTRCRGRLSSIKSSAGSQPRCLDVLARPNASCTTSSNSGPRAYRRAHRARSTSRTGRTTSQQRRLTTTPRVLTILTWYYRAQLIHTARRRQRESSRRVVVSQPGAGTRPVRCGCPPLPAA